MTMIHPRIFELASRFKTDRFDLDLCDQLAVWALTSPQDGTFAHQCAWMSLRVGERDAEVRELVKALRQAREALLHLPADALGTAGEVVVPGCGPDGELTDETQRSIRDEMVDEFNRLLARYPKEEDDAR